MLKCSVSSASSNMVALAVISLVGLLASFEAAVAPVKNSVQHGHPLILLQFNGSKINTDFEAVNDLFMHQEVRDRKIVVVSIIGGFREGKSFFMNYCLRFMYANVSRNIYCLRKCALVKFFSTNL